jgi:hypothetical protein
MRKYHLAAPILLLLSYSIQSATTDELWFGAPDGEWVPDPALILHVKASLDAKLRPFLSTRGRTTLPAVGYWFQFRGRGAGANKYIEIVGFPLPLSRHPDTVSYFGPWIPEACIVHARYNPSGGDIDELAVSGVTCPARI